MDGRTNTVRRGRSRPEGQRTEKRCATADGNTQGEQCHPRKIFVGGLAHTTTTQHLRDHFGRFGGIVDAVVLRWPDGRSRGFGYVTLTDSVAVAAVLKQTHKLSGREVDVKPAVPGTNKLFVGGLPQNTTANELREHFEKFGVVSDAVVMIDPATSRSRGFGFVCFLPGPEGAAAVTSSLEQYENHRIRGKWIEVKSAAPPHKLAAKNGAQPAPSYEELALAGALPEMGRPASSPSPSVENREPNARKASISALGSPRKIELPATAAELGSALRHAPPPGIAGAMFECDDKTKSTDMWGSSPWSQPFGSPWSQPFGSPGYGYGGFPAFPGPPLGMNQFGDGYLASMPPSQWAPPCMDQSGGMSAGESLQHNLELFLRQGSALQKMEFGMNGREERDPSVSTACSTPKQVEPEGVTHFAVL